MSWDNKATSIIMKRTLADPKYKCPEIEIDFLSILLLKTLAVGKFWLEKNFLFPVQFVSKYLLSLLSENSADLPKHPKSESLDSANYLNFPQNYSLRTRKLPTLLCWILSQRAKALKMCQSDVKKCHKCLMNMLLWVESYIIIRKSSFHCFYVDNLLP